MSQASIITDNELQEIKNLALMNRVSKSQPHLKNCKCCDSPVIVESLRIDCEVEDFAHIGLLYPLYFQFIMYIGAYLGLASLFSLVNVHLNSEGSSCLTSSYSCLTSITNIITEEDSQDDIDLQTINNYLFIAASVLYLEIMCSVLKKKCRIMREHKDMESDYGVILKGVKSTKPTDVYNQIKHLEARYFAFANKTNRIIRFAKLTDMKAFSEQEQQLLTQRDKSVDQIRFDSRYDPRIQSAGFISDVQSDTTANPQNIMLNNLTSHSHFGKIIVFFEYPIKLSEIDGPDLEHLNDPSDIIWENIGLEKQENKSLLLLIGTGFFMFMAFLTILTLKLWIKKVSENSHMVTSSLLNLLVATVVAVFNSIEGIVIRSCARKELYGTHSKFFRIVARRLSYIFFINMVMTTFFSNLVIFLWSSDEQTNKILPLDYDGLVRDFFFLFITNSYISSIFNYFDLFYGIKLYKRQKLEKYRSRNGYSHEEVNFIFEGHPVDMGLRYGNIMKTLFFTAFISPFVPLGTIFSAVGLFICYWVDKYLLLSRYVCRHELSPNFAKQMSQFSKFYVVLYAFSNMLLQIIPLNKDDQIQPSNLGLFISIGVFVGTLIYKFVLTTVKKTIFKKILRGRCNEDKKYEKVKHKFRNCFEDKLNIFHVNNLKAEENNTHQSVDQKLLETVRISTIQRVIEEYP